MIITIRHTTPFINYERCVYKAARRRLIDYNSTTKINTDEIDDIIEDMTWDDLGQGNLVGLVSALPRASVTAEYIGQFIKFRKEYNSLYQELDLNIIRIPFIIKWVRVN